MAGLNAVQAGLQSEKSNYITNELLNILKTIVSYNWLVITYNS
jgi:hypothetical protein